MFPITFKESTPRQKDRLFQRPLLNFKPIPSYLIGWDFPLNPAQFGVTVAASLGANNHFMRGIKRLYSSLPQPSGVSVSRGTTGALNLFAAATTQMAIIQYLDGAQVQKILLEAASGGISSNIRMLSSVAQGI